MTEKKNSPIEQHYETLKSELRKNRRISPFWLLPFIALCIGALLFFQIVQERGETITITFNDGAGLVADKTEVRYQGLQIGLVKKVNFTDNLQKVEVTANIFPEAANVLRKNTKFWLVQPNVSLAGISGLDSLVSGNYITLQPGDGDRENQFIAEDQGPIAQVRPGDLLIHLVADDLGYISAGASVYFKKMPVGTIYDYRINKENKVDIDVVIDKKYAQFVKKDSHFWNISGINANIGANGLNVAMDSLNSVIQGAVAFDSPEDSPIAGADTVYPLYANLQAAKRGFEIAVNIPTSVGLEAGQTGVFYNNEQIGTLSALETVKDNEQILAGTLLIDPNQTVLFKNNTRIVLRHGKLNLATLTDPKNLLRGEYFEVLPGNGEAQTQFDVIKENELLLKEPNTLVFNLRAPETYGVAEGQSIYYNNFPIGEVVEQTIGVNGVVFKVAISGTYRNLIHQDSQFVAANNLDLSIGLDGLKFTSATPDKWLAGGVRLLNSEQPKGQAQENYPLYRDLDSAAAGITEINPQPTITLHTHNLPSIDKGSLVLYRQYEVGKVLAVRPKLNEFEVDLYIYPKQRHLLTDKSLFWVESAAQIDITPKGISIQATPIMRSLKGAISFDNSGSGANKNLYANELRAKSAGQIITLFSDDATALSKGMSLRYLGLTVGEIDSISLDNKTNRIVAKAMINPNYMAKIAKAGSQFKVISPQISAGGIENLDSLLQPYIDIEIGQGATKTQFNLQQTAQARNKYSHGTAFVLETKDAMNITEGSPILYRGVQVGSVGRLDLNSLGDRVLVNIVIIPQYQHLVRKNSEFWVASGYDVSLGWQGMQLNTGSVQQLLKGGISFSTPSSTVVQPQATAGQRFLLQVRRPNEAQNWNSGALPAPAAQ